MPRSRPAGPLRPFATLVPLLLIACGESGGVSGHVAAASDAATAVCGELLPAHAPDALTPFARGYSIPTAGNGVRQSPIDIRTRELAEGAHDFELHYQASGEHVRNLGHTVQVQWDRGSYVMFDGVRYEFVQLHFHTPSEHRVDGVTYPLEAHLVHIASDPLPEPRYLVIGVLFREGGENAFLARFLDAVPDRHGDGADHPDRRHDIDELLGDGLREYFRYTGSLTTPPYSETVQWLVAGRPFEASPAQIERINRLEGNNARHIQEPAGRVVERARMETPDLRGND